MRILIRSLNGARGVGRLATQLSLAAALAWASASDNAWAQGKQGAQGTQTAPGAQSANKGPSPMPSAGGATLPPIVDLGTFGRHQVYLTTAPMSMRMGKGVLVHVMRTYSTVDLIASQRLWASCDGRWISELFLTDTINPEGREKDIWTPRTWEQKLRSMPVSPAIYPVDLTPWQDAQIDIAEPLRSRIGALCRSAADEERNRQLPVASFSEMPKETSRSTPPREGQGQRHPKDGEIVGILNLVSGTVKRFSSSDAPKSSHGAATIEYWVETVYFKRETLVNADNQPIVWDGEMQTVLKPTGKREMTRFVGDCQAMRLGSIQFASYQDGKVTDSQSIPRDNVKLEDVFPRSVGEAHLKAVCTIY